MKAKILQLSDAHKWTLLLNYQQMAGQQTGDQRDTPDHWISVLNVDPAVEI